MVEGTAERLEFSLILTPFGSAFHLLIWSSAVRFSIQCPAVQTVKHSGRTCQTKRARIQFSHQSKTILLGSQTINKLKTVRRQQSVWTRTKRVMYNRSSRPSSIHLSDNEIFVNSETEATDSRENSPSPTEMEKTGLLPRTMRRANSKVLTPEVLDLCAKEIQQENLFRKRYEQAALYVYGTSQRHCGLDSTALSSQPGSVYKIPHLSDPCFTGFGYFRWSGIE